MRCCYILGKHSNVRFTNNTNTESSSERSLLGLEDSHILTQQLIEDSCLEDGVGEIDTVIVEAVKTVVSKLNYDLLEQFESNKIELVLNFKTLRNYILYRLSYLFCI